MDVRAAGLLLIWLGAGMVAIVLVHRARAGAWAPLAFHRAPPLAPWAKAATAAGLVSAVVGTGLVGVDLVVRGLG